MSGKLQPHRRALDAPADAGMTRYAGCQDKYISMAAKMSQKLPHPSRKGMKRGGWSLECGEVFGRGEEGSWWRRGRLRRKE